MYYLNLYVMFTASNGNPRLPDSLHYIDHSGRPNAYQKVRIEICILQYKIYTPIKIIVMLLYVF